MEEALGRSAFILGYSGEVGKELVKEVVKSNIYQKVVLIGRRKIEYKDESLASLVSFLYIITITWSTHHLYFVNSIPNFSILQITKFQTFMNFLKIMTGKNLKLIFLQANILSY